MRPCRLYFMIISYFFFHRWFLFLSRLSDEWMISSDDWKKKCDGRINLKGSIFFSLLHNASKCKENQQSIIRNKIVTNLEYCHLLNRLRRTVPSSPRSKLTIKVCPSAFHRSIRLAKWIILCSVSDFFFYFTRNIET